MSLHQHESTRNNQAFIQDVISFIDQPLSPQSLSKLKRSCKQQAFGDAAGAAASPSQQQHHHHYHSQPQLEARPLPPPPQEFPALRTAADAEAVLASAVDGAHVLFPLGAEIEAQNLTNTTEFNGLRGKVVGHQDDKVLVQFHGGSGQVFDIPTYNLRFIAGPSAARSPSPQASAAAPAYEPLQPPAPLPAAPITPAVPTYGNYGLGVASPSAESITLQAKLKCAMSHVESAKDAMRLATQLHIVDSDALYSVIQEFQPTLTRANIAKNWAKIIQIYQAHAERVAAGQAPEVPPGSTTVGAPATGPATGGSYAPEDMTSNLQGVINFIDAPLSPRSLKEVRTIRHSLSPRRGRSGSPAA